MADMLQFESKDESQSSKVPLAQPPLPARDAYRSR